MRADDPAAPGRSPWDEPARVPRAFDASGEVLMIDTHVHIWDRRRSPYSWIPSGSAWDRSFSPDSASSVLRDAGFGSAVLVQADDTTEDTDYLLEVARQHAWVAGVVGWIPLDTPDAAHAALRRRADERALVGVRHLVHVDPRPQFLAMASVHESAALLADAGLALDVPDAYPAHLDDARVLAESLPTLQVVIDHLAKPPVGHPSMAGWEQRLREIGECGNVSVKFSGLHANGVPHQPGEIEDLLSLALEVFGGRRIMYGGDWPMTVPGGGYAPMWRIVSDAMDRLLSAEEREAVLSANAQRIYRLDAAGLNPLSRADAER